MVSTASAPAFSARVIGTFSNALANASMAICSRPPIDLAISRICFDRYMNAAPPPTRNALSMKATDTTPTASSNALSNSSAVCELTPLNTTVTGLIASMFPELDT